jgi:hypothetical protein
MAFAQTPNCAFEADPMGPRISTLFVAAVLALPFHCVSQELDRLEVTMRPFEAVGKADPEFAKSLGRQLKQAIERRSEFRIAPGGPTPYYLKGQVFADGQRHFVTLQLLEAKTDRTLWVENYDYRGITADVMATDVIAALYSASGSDRGP